MSKAFLGTVVFTAIEIATLILWLELRLQGKDVLAALSLVGLLVEHYVSVNVGAGRPPFGPLPPDKP